LKWVGVEIVDIEEKWFKKNWNEFWLSMADDYGALFYTNYHLLRSVARVVSKRSVPPRNWNLVGKLFYQLQKIKNWWKNFRTPLPPRNFFDYTLTSTVLSRGLSYLFFNPHKKIVKFFWFQAPKIVAFRNKLRFCTPTPSLQFFQRISEFLKIRIWFVSWFWFLIA